MPVVDSDHQSSMQQEQRGKRNKKQVVDKPKPP
jgi:hypothetical protein